MVFSVTQENGQSIFMEIIHIMKCICFWNIIYKILSASTIIIMIIMIARILHAIYVPGT